ncbi:MAG: hypothetical protein HY593_03880 [Candidatus Omnitrophica bacterium]|nr:hypothetical protein [Candidatus Omnitrophota bacterium]
MIDNPYKSKKIVMKLIPVLILFLLATFWLYSCRLFSNNKSDPPLKKRTTKFSYKLPVGSLELTNSAEYYYEKKTRQGIVKPQRDQLISGDVVITGTGPLPPIKLTKNPEYATVAMSQDNTVATLRLTKVPKTGLGFAFDSEPGQFIITDTDGKPIPVIGADSVTYSDA